ncbi:7-cyano-7-deazaguanine reductase [Desulfuromusa kysingii]|uniref:7-cyano-7-deazaguanine reductase n=1 Tax=Desulfuromusa kysingii TaxID=37625 RepID=A0A1H3VVW1_9BACT|nr:NADPH-dependent 7-cyano-7-deazaguanine reductase QueF [Desulfuromusa kysingii]SDZ78995.1 7-cyano-7-deazaguanine reductase [Desulfuromusa kysingii]
MVDHKLNLPLGEKTAYKAEYDPALLCPFPRQIKRDEIGVAEDLPFSGYDIWNAFELSWLNLKGKPVVAMGEFHIPCESPNLVESKSFKLYLNSFNQTCFSGFEQVEALLVKDLCDVCGAPILVRLFDSRQFDTAKLQSFPGTCIDGLDIEVKGYSLNPALLKNATDSECRVEEELYSHLLKSNCLVTNQPDWGSVLIRYCGRKIDQESLLRYLISFRQHNEFHEQCVERIFMDLMRHCQPERLTVYARYTRRGGLDINPFRSNYEDKIENLRLARQ